MNRRIGFLAAGVAVALMAAGGTAFAAVSSIPDSSGVIHGCYDSGGNVKVIDTSVTSTCPKGYTSLNWNQTGPQGPQGPAGAAGPSTAGSTGLDIQNVSMEFTSDGPGTGAYDRSAVSCPADHPYVTGGGWLNFGSAVPVINGDYPLGDTAGWQVEWNAPAGSQIVVYALCSK
jgi:hypothetical protein